ncbi:MAG: DUF2950 domain-containing protein [Hyphomicrobium sp.]|nr:DUF2950 domain-containing protein [Hyphomicrobium sp.]
MRRINPSTFGKFLTTLLLIMVAVAPARAQEAATYKSPDDAVTAFVDALRADNPGDALVSVLGVDGQDIASSGDDVADAARRARFIEAFNEAHSLQADGDSKSTLVIGKDEFPFPIPLVKDGDQWKWDVAAGVDQILTRRIGENEISAIEVMRAYVAAQLEYAEQPRDGRGIQYARRLMSREGRKDGLYWETAEGEPDSPIGPLVAKAQSEGYKGRAKRDDGQTSYHGYLYRMLYGQGPSATDGARDYIVNDRMIGGFGLIATPADYGNSGVMTFIVNQDGVVYQKDLGPDTAAEAARIRLFNPDKTWTKVESQ